ncbi:MAG: cupredoxin domain-containing protein [Sandaracinaceae bacterium]|nr:cupredoxin domain-containing protein [Sandaracinaceae bacterium]
MRSIVVPLALTFLALGCDKKPAPETTAPAAAASPIGEVKGRPIAITAGADGFKPNEVKITKGEEATLVFTRTTNDTCADKVVFPDLKIEKELPLNKPVAIVVPSGEAKTLAFQCGMGMYKSKVVVQ